MPLFDTEFIDLLSKNKQDYCKYDEHIEDYRIGFFGVPAQYIIGIGYSITEFCKYDIFDQRIFVFNIAKTKSIHHTLSSAITTGYSARVLLDLLDYEINNARKIMGLYTDTISKRGLTLFNNYNLIDTLRLYNAGFKNRHGYWGVPENLLEFFFLDGKKFAAETRLEQFSVIHDIAEICVTYYDTGKLLSAGSAVTALLDILQYDNVDDIYDKYCRMKLV